MPGPDPRKARLMQGPQGRRSKEKKESVPFVIDPETGMKIFIKTIEMGKDGIQTVDMKAKGGRAGFKHGSKGCKLAMKGKGRAYGKNS